MFTRSGSTRIQHGEALMNRERIAEGGEEGFGIRLALSSDGNTAPIAREALSTELPANAWAFSRSGSVSTQQFPPLTCGGEQRGNGDIFTHAARRCPTMATRRCSGAVYMDPRGHHK